MVDFRYQARTRDRERRVVVKIEWHEGGLFLRIGLNLDTVIFSGCDFPNCPRTSIYESSERDFRTVMVKDAISGLCDRGKEELEKIGTTLVTADECVRTLRSLQYVAILGHAGGTHEGYGTLTDARLLEAIDSIDFSKQGHSYGL